MNPLLGRAVQRAISREAPIGAPVAIAVGLLVVTFLDAVTGPYLSFSIFYLLPIGLGALRYGRRLGLGLAAIGAVLWYLVDRASGLDYPSQILPIWNALVRFGLFAIVALLLDALRVLVLEEASAARWDTVSALLNRRGFAEAAERELERARRTRAPISFVYLDVDDFKTVNDELGHAAGDRTLAAVGRAISHSIRSIDLAARLGGDEFVVCLPDSKLAAAESVVGRLRATLGADDSGVPPVGLSIGIVSFTEAPASLDIALHAVDEAMYRAKNGIAKNQTSAIERTGEVTPA